MSPKVLASKPFLVTLKYACKPYLSYHAIFDDFFISYNQLQFSVLSKILFECVWMSGNKYKNPWHWIKWSDWHDKITPKSDGELLFKMSC